MAKLKWLTSHSVKNDFFQSKLLRAHVQYVFNESAKDQGPVVQSIVSLTSSLVVKMITVLISTISNSQATHIFSAKILAYMPYLMIKVLRIGLTNNIVSFEQLGPELVNKFF